MQIASAKDKNPIFGELCFYRVITEIWDLDYTMFRIPIFKCDWVDNKNGIRVDDLGFTLVDFSKMAHKSDPFILASRLSKFSMYKMNLIQDGQLFYQLLNKISWKWTRVKNNMDNSIEHHPVISSLPQVESFDVMDDTDAICMRDNCEGIWVENKSYM